MPTSKCHYFVNRPHMLADARFHSWSDSQGLMKPYEVVVHMEQRDHGDVMIQLLAERIRQAREAPHVHPPVEILSFHVRRANVRVIRCADDVDTLGAQTLCRAVALLPFRIVAVDLHQLRVVNSLRERIRNGYQIHLVPVRGQLDSIRQTAFNVLKERSRTPGIPSSYHPRNHELGLSFNRGKCPNVSASPRFHLFGGDVLFFAADKRPDLIDLNAFRGNVADNAVLVISTSRADADQEPKDSAFRHARQSDGGANRAAFNKRRYHRRFLFRADYVCHNQSIRQRFRIVKRKTKTDRFLCRVFHFCPSRFSGFSGTSFALFVGHGLKATLPADLPALGPHLPHDLLNDSELNGLCGFNGFQENAPGILYGIKVFCTASPLWHTSSVARTVLNRQGLQISNGPTTEISLALSYGPIPNRTSGSLDEAQPTK